ncbi:type III-B CRISPR module RAMP protein Cmr4 [Ahniella affigens]|uniref:Type III-B CRISPR module RAMP protein Cmr4 n=1 Tax=Ahniella affigens TaxID=2021234 RepID=A0A2P1PTR2_9GAMM|nr:type III-B CRISPR module RAMP protein Cmr4 [Ahniella affigens]AVP98229.1 type III-B CRISPR module RAMP protein Cmr4 [Ahniella affigens]
MRTEVFFLQALSAVHVGIGQAIGAVDLPIARAKATNLPQIPGSAIKGVLRADVDANTAHSSHVSMLFGPESKNADKEAHAGALAFGDANLLILPVRSWVGVMAYATCPFVLRRYRDDAIRAGGALPKEPTSVTSGQAQTAKVTAIKYDSSKIALDDLELSCKSEDAEAWADHFAKHLRQSQTEQDYFKQHFVILSDEDFSFLSETATEIRARIRINHDRGTVDRGALWYEENLPAETVLWGVLGVGPSRKPEAGDAKTARVSHDAAAVATTLRQVLKLRHTIQIGGKATVGRGLAQFILSK